MADMLRPLIRRCLTRPWRTMAIDDVRRWRRLDMLLGAIHLADHINRTTEAPRVGLMLPTSGAFAMAMMATWWTGRTVVPINYLLTAEERQYLVEDAELDCIITADAMLKHLDGAPRGVNLIELDKHRFHGLPPMRWPARLAGDHIAVILYTSGTSGKPKGVMLSHDNLHANVRACVDHASIRRADGFLGVLPQFHSFGLTALTLLPMCVGATAIYTARFSPRKIIELLREHRPHVFIAIPSMFAALLSVKNASADDFKSLRYIVSGSEPLAQDVVQQFEQRFGVRIQEGYGLTETSPVVAWALPGNTRAGSVGTLLPNVHVRIVDDHDHNVAPGEEGEVLISGPNVMQGYFKQPQLTRQILEAGRWLRTGDWGRLDDQGNLYITGRKKDMLIIGGENVFPGEIEQVIDRHPAVRQAAVIGRCDEMRGEVPIAYIELNEDTSVDPSDLRAYCRQHMAQFKVPRQIHIIDALPRSSTGKILRRRLSEMDHTT